MIKILTVLVLLLSGAAAAQATDSLKPYTPGGLVFLSDAALFVPASFSLIMFHELGHYSMAAVSGAHGAKFGLYRTTKKGETQIGWAVNGYVDSRLGRGLINAGGVMFSRGLAELSHLAVKSDVMPAFGNRFFSMLFIMGKFDFARYVLQDALLNMGGMSGSDMDSLVTEISGGKTAGRTITYAALLALAVYDIVVDWDRIAAHWGVITGRKGHMENQTVSLHVAPYVGRYGIGLSLSLR